MRIQKIKRISLFLVVLTIVLAIASCTSTETPQDKGSGTSNEGKLFAEPTEISMVVGSHASWPYNEDWVIWQYFKEATGANFNVTAIPNTDMGTKLTLMMADKGSLSDLIFIDSKLWVDGYAEVGALVAFDDYIDRMPNYTKFCNSIPEEERERCLIQRRSADGKTYFPQNYGTDSRQGIRSWLYRKDIFEKHNLQVPETMDEVYKVAKELKKLYPESYPLCMREGLGNIGVIGSQWKPDFTYGLYYDFTNSKWSYGATEPIMREIVEYMRKMHAEALIPPNYININVKSWEELMSTDRGFILQDYVVRVDNFNNPNRQQNPEYTLAAMKPPRANTQTAQHLMNKFNVDPQGFVICNTGDKKRITNAIKLVDWMYSDKAAELLSWGKEGETYEVKEGKKQFIRPEEGNIEGKYGLFSYGTYLRVDPEASLAIASEEQAASVSLALKYTELNYNPTRWLAFNSEEAKKRDDYAETISTFTSEMLSKFLYNQEPMSKWDQFVNSLNDLGIKEYIALYDKAYQELKK